MTRWKFALAVAATASIAAGTGVRADTPGVVNIGFTGPLSGGAAQYGADVQRGIQMAIDQLNTAGGITAGGKKYTFKLVSLDDQYRPPESQINAKRLVQESNTPVVFCPHSGGILALLKFNDKDPKFVVGAYSSEPAILKQNDPLLLMIPPRFDEYFKPWIAVEMKKFGKKLGLLPTATAYGNAWKSGFGDAWKAAGGTVLGDNAVDYNTTTDFSGTVSKALSEKPDVMLVGGPSQPTALVIKAAREQGYKGGFVMMDQAKFEQVKTVVSIADLEGVVGTSPMRNYTGPGVNSFLVAYAKAYGRSNEANSEAGLNFMAMKIFARAMEISNNVSDPSVIAGKIEDAAKSLPSKDQPAAIDGVSKAGHLELEVLSFVVDGGKFVPVHITALP